MVGLGGRHQIRKGHTVVYPTFTKVLRCATMNLPSRKIPERLGFKTEGTIRDGEWLNDHFVDSVVYGLLDKEWRAE